ncbi:MAG: hypothetical protein COA76_17045 [Moritella sp.]|nr:MAG: hypothetical protein COA76_17045 [Moritella sp.]
MGNDVWERDEVESPCTQICVVHPETNLCTGCARTLDEISRWSQMTMRDQPSFQLLVMRVVRL